MKTKLGQNERNDVTFYPCRAFHLYPFKGRGMNHKVTQMAFRTKGEILTSNIYVRFFRYKEKNTGDMCILIFYYYCSL